MQVNHNYFRKYNMYYVSPKDTENIHSQIRLDQKSFPIMSGDLAADTPSQSNLDNIENYIVSVQNTK